MFNVYLIQYLTMKNAMKVILLLITGNAVICGCSENISEGQVMHENKIMVIPWVSGGNNNRESMEKALKMGSDGFFADDPGLWKQMVEKYNHND